MNVVAGIIRDEEKGNFIKILFRLSRGKIYSFFRKLGRDAVDYNINQLGAAQP